MPLLDAAGNGTSHPGGPVEALGNEGYTMNNQLTSPVARLGRRMVDFALESAGGRGQIERSLVEHHHSPAATALAPIAWFESSLLWVGLRLSGPPVLTSR